jgi:hypothetical protein
MFRTPIYLAAIITASLVAGVIAARAGQRAMRWAIYGTLEQLYGNR